MRRLFVLACLIAVAAATFISPAFAARTFPEEAKRGELKSHSHPYLKIGDKVFRLAPGGKIFNEQNFIIMPASLRAQSAQIVYLTDMNGDLARVWLLTAEEARKYPVKKP